MRMFDDAVGQQERSTRPLFDKKGRQERSMRPLSDKKLCLRPLVK